MSDGYGYLRDKGVAGKMGIVDIDPPEAACVIDYIDAWGSTIVVDENYAYVGTGWDLRIIKLW